ncbi:MAG: DUF1501 domain-containing protein, partial [Planctomycetota bacterium]|nr:DUF1501 domain-containing protein [Planctomycetota bacterium]
AAGRNCDGVNRRGFLRIGSLGAGLSLADLLRLRAADPRSAERREKSVIMVSLRGGPSHLDMYDLKPEAPTEIRGEFKSIATNVDGIRVCELLPLQATIADKLAIIRNMKFAQGQHSPVELMTGFSENEGRPALGSAFSHLRRRNVGPLPPYVALDNFAYPAWLGVSHKPFVPHPRLQLNRPRGVTADRLADRRVLLETFGGLPGRFDESADNLQAIDAFTAQALEMITSPTARDALDLSNEPPESLERYGPLPECRNLLKARRLVEAGVPIVQTTLSMVTPRSPNGWDTHADNFGAMRHILPAYDRAIHSLITDLSERGLSQDVVVVIWGEFGRHPFINNKRSGRDHWQAAGFALLSGGGLQMGQVIGATDRHGTKPSGGHYMPQNVLATLYRVLGIDPALTIPNHAGRPVYLLDDRTPVAELV